MHAEAYAFVRDSLAEFSVLEFGSLNVNGSVRDLFAGWDYVGVDRTPGPGVDVIADAATFDTPQRFDAVVCCEVFEHFEHWAEIVNTARCLLKPGGVFIGTAAGPGREPHKCDGSPLTDGSEFYANVAPADLEKRLKMAGFSAVRVESLGPDVRWRATA